MKTLVLIFNLLFFCSCIFAQFGPKVLIDSSIINPSFVIAVDIDFDNDSDIIVGDSEEFGPQGSGTGVTLFRNIDNQGVFEPGVTLFEGRNISSLHAADIDHDGDQDILISIDYIKSTWVLWNEDGFENSFPSTQIINNLGVAGYYSTIPVDIDNDCLVDIFTSIGKWHKNLGSGNFSDAIPYAVDKLDGYRLNAFSIADLDGDQDDDFIVSRYNFARDSVSLSWIENINGIAEFEDEHLIATQYTSSPASFSTIHTVDIDKDNDIDMLVGDGVYDKVLLFANSNNSGIFNEAIIVGEDANFPSSILTHDIDGDDDLDIFVSLYNESIVWYENLGNNNFSTENFINNDLNGTHNLHLTDLNNDNAVDLISVSHNSLLQKQQVVWNTNLFEVSILGNSEVDSSSVLLYPNPTSEPVFLNIIANELGIWQIQILNLSGQTIKTLELTIPENTEIRVCLGELPPGTYIVNATSNDFSYSEILIVF